MATTVLGTTKSIPAKYISGSTDPQSTQSKAVYTVTQNATTTVLTVEVRFITGGYYSPQVSGTVSATGQSAKTLTKVQCASASSYTTESKLATYTFTWSKTTSNQGNKTVSFNLYPYKAGSSYATTLSFAVPVPAKASYAVKYGANGGGSAPASQTKWHGQALTLASAITDRTNYAFQKWNTASNGSGTNYSAGASYTGNAALTLYAQWRQVYASPTIKVTKALRVDSAGELDDEGAYALVTVQHALYDTGSNSIASSSVTVNGVTQPTPLASTGTELSGTRTYLVDSAMGTESRYEVTASLTDSAGGTSGRSSATATAKGEITAAYYPLDILRGGHGIAFGKPATREDALEAFYGGVLLALASGVLSLSHGQASTDSMLKAERTDTGTKVGMGVGLNGITHGIYSYAVNRWLIHANETQAFLNGARVDVVTTNAGTAFIEVASGVTITAFSMSTWGKVATVRIGISTSTAKSGSWNIGTVKSGYRPATEAGLISAGASAAKAWIGTSGTFSAENATVAAGGGLVFKGTYVMQ